MLESFLVKYRLPEVSDADVNIQSRLLPVEPELLLPQESCWAFCLVIDQLLHNISGVHIQGDERDDLGPVCTRQLACPCVCIG